MQTLGIYVQVPFCASKCSFCNFSSRVEHAGVFDEYCRALELEIERLPVIYEGQGTGRQFFELPVDTVYLGGGTPSLLGARRLAGIIAALRRRFQLRPPLEFTLEITPGSAESDFLAGARDLGINRLSIGAETFDDGELRAVGRLHSAAETCELVRLARRAGFENISLDLIAGLPYQTEASWLKSLREAASLRPEHVSLYLFEIDARSRLGREVLDGGTRYHASAVPSEEFMADAYEAGREFLTREGYTQYEISNFALPGFESRHNQKYWQLAPYVGLGAGAHSFDGAHRWANEANPKLYGEKLASNASPVAEVRSLSPVEQLEEFFFLGLRQREGVNLLLAARRWGSERVNSWRERINTLARDGWLEEANGRIWLTERAYLVSNEIFQEFVVA
jgi:oxygen-independent coproporphyrinogen-3 oxidase